MTTTNGRSQKGSKRVVDDGHGRVLGLTIDFLATPWSCGILTVSDPDAALLFLIPFFYASAHSSLFL